MYMCALVTPLYNLVAFSTVPLCQREPPPLSISLLLNLLASFLPPLLFSFFSPPTPPLPDPNLHIQTSYQLIKTPIRVL